MYSGTMQNNSGDQPQTQAPVQQGNDVDKAKATEQAFMQDIQQTPKEAVPAGTTQAAPAVDTPAAENSGGIFSSDFYKKFLPGTEDKKPDAEAQPQAEQPQPAKEPYRPFAGTEQEQPTTGSTAQAKADNGDTYYKKALAVEKMKNMGVSRLLAMLEGTPNYEKYKLSDTEVVEMAAALSEWKPEFVEQMPPYAQYAMLNATFYAPYLVEALNNGAINRRNARIKAQVAPTGNTMQQAAGMVVPFHVNQAQQQKPVAAKGERNRFELHSDGTYVRSRKFPNMPTKYLNIGDPECEKVDLGNIEELKHVILKNGGWKKVARILDLSHEWMASRGLNTNNPTIAD